MQVFISSLGLFRDAEQQFRSALKLQDMVEIYLYLGKVSARLDQPLAALQIYTQVQIEIFLDIGHQQYIQIIYMSIF